MKKDTNEETRTEEVTDDDLKRVQGAAQEREDTQRGPSTFTPTNVQEE